jgi:hypothetical protein
MKAVMFDRIGVVKVGGVPKPVIKAVKSHKMSISKTDNVLKVILNP